MRQGAAAVILFVAACSEPSQIDVGTVEVGLAACALGAVTQGIDVSHHDGTIDWSAVKSGGIDFAIMKATESTNFVDPMFATNWAGAGQSKIVRGAYHFFRPAADAVAQADFFVQNAGIPGAGDFPLTIDLEATDGLGSAQVA